MIWFKSTIIERRMQDVHDGVSFSHFKTNFRVFFNLMINYYN